MSLIQKMMPARSQALEEKKYKLIADLDEIMAEVYVLKILGKEYELKPITGLKLRELDNAHTKVKIVSQRLVLGENVPFDEMMKAYYDFCHLVMGDLTLSDMYSMTTKQVNELLKICFRYATNQELDTSPQSIETELDEKKNSLK